MFISLANTGQIAQGAQLIASDMRRSTTNARNFYNWISAQSDADLLALPNPFVQGDIDKMRSMAADLSALGWNIYHGQAPPNTYTLPYDFSLSSAQIIGPLGG